MMISLRARLVFLAMTKTGSTAIENALRKHCEIIFSGAPQVTHMTYRRYSKHVAPYLQAMDFGTFETTAVLRHPVSWLGSWYLYRQRPALDGRPESTKDMSFEGFTERYCDGDPNIAGIGRPWEFLRDSKQALGVDHVFAYENLDRLTGFWAKRLDAPIVLGTANASPLGSTFLSPKLLSRLENHLHREFDLYETVAGNGSLPE